MKIESALAISHAVASRVGTLVNRHQPLCMATAAYAAASAVVFLGGWLGISFLPKSVLRGADFGFSEWYTNWDGQWYANIVQRGYFFDSNGYSSVVFFPLYPMVGWLVSLTGLSVPVSLQFVTAACGLAFSAVWHRYCLERSKGDRRTADIALLLVLFWPSSYFLHLVYTESLFVLLLATLLLSFQNRWKIRWSILIAGLAAATRPTGVLCCVAVAYHAWNSGRTRPVASRLLTASTAGLAAGWGLWVYMAFLWREYANPLTFIVAERAWHVTGPVDIDGLFDLLFLGPVQRLFEAAAADPALIPGAFLNAVLWLVAVFSLVFGAITRRLTAEESLVSGALALVPYTAVGNLSHMPSMGRYSLIILPVYFVLAGQVGRFSSVPRSLVLALLAALCCAYSALFSCWYLVY